MANMKIIAKPVPLYDRNCDQCGKHYVDIRPKYCSKTCSNKAGKAAWKERQQNSDYQEVKRHLEQINFDGRHPFEKLP